MNKWQRRTAYYAALVVSSMLVFSVLYQNGMQVYEGRPRTFLHSLQVVVETFTTTGFGSDSPWNSPEMQVLVIGMDLVGTLLIFMALPVFAFPLLEDILSTTVPTSVPDDTEEHVIICSYRSRAEVLIDELDSWGVDHVIVEPDRERATDLYENGHRVIHTDPTSIAGLKRAEFTAARALVSDAPDQVDASIVLAAQAIAEDVPVISVIEEPDRRSYHQLAGADHVLSPRPLLGESLASKVTTSLTPDLDEAVDIGDNLEVAELPIHRESRLVGTTLAESGIREQSDVNVVGIWSRGEFETPPSPDTTLTDGMVLLVTGRETNLKQLKQLTLSGTRQTSYGEAVIIGYGTVGSRISAALDEAGVSSTVIDRTEATGVDVIGDATEPETLHEAGIEDAQSVILAMPDDTTTEFVTLVIRDITPETEIIARAEETESIQKMYQAGADYVLSLATISGRMIASTILEDEEVLSLDQQVTVVRTVAPDLVGQTIGNADIRLRTGCTVVGIDRNGTVITDIGPEVSIEAGDELIITGTEKATRQFTEQMT